MPITGSILDADLTSWHGTLLNCDFATGVGDICGAGFCFCADARTIVDGEDWWWSLRGVLKLLGVFVLALSRLTLVLCSSFGVWTSSCSGVLKFGVSMLANSG
ncbi:hypothetical protein OGATHE_003433 [Ogataea polymorpha]|uniref:Transmembrane protein n=1 Tax=Ogataea polymorpha TaxID=460523 RepID=A0A9P8P2Z9_9ASCO|nr:hypothetical protein OGATHE_003433 [Ogataea polymorpha]